MAREIIDEQGNRIYERDAYISNYSPVARVIWFILGIINTLIAIRFLLKLFAANPGAGFTNFVYSATSGLIAPFTGVIHNTIIGSGNFEWASLLAIIIYWLIAWALVSLFNITRPVPRY